MQYEHCENGLPVETLAQAAGGQTYGLEGAETQDKAAIYFQVAFDGAHNFDKSSRIASVIGTLWWETTGQTPNAQKEGGVVY
eukprot:COSAG02_NODE_1531_length_12086_cov_22.388588_5_plen_82_part_00